MKCSHLFQFHLICSIWICLKFFKTLDTYHKASIKSPPPVRVPTEQPQAERKSVDKRVMKPPLLPGKSIYLPFLHLKLQSYVSHFWFLFTISILLCQFRQTWYCWKSIKGHIISWKNKMKKNNKKKNKVKQRWKKTSFYSEIL